MVAFFEFQAFAALSQDAATAIRISKRSQRFASTRNGHRTAKVSEMTCNIVAQEDNIQKSQLNMMNNRQSLGLNKNRKTNGMNRRQFLQTSAASAMFLSLGSVPSFAAPGTQDNSIPWVTLNNGVRMPRLGLGTMTLNGDVGVRCVADAISLGYRLIDTAMIYNTEGEVGEGIKQSGIKHLKTVEGRYGV
jgi:hypothetical protein